MSTKTEPRRIIFQGNATPFGARIVSIEQKPFHDIVPGPPSSSLSVEGGRSLGESHGSGYRDIFRWGATLADCKGELRTDGHPVTTVISSIEEFTTVNKPHKFEAGRLRVAMTSDLGPTGQPRITPFQISFDELRIDGDAIEIEHDNDFIGLPTFSEFEAEYQRDQAFYHKYQHCLQKPGPFQSALPRLPGGQVALSFVHSFKWQGKDHPGNVLELAGFGKLYFGEVLMTANTRTMTMVRLVLGCSVGGSAAAAQGDPTISWGN
jgi:hypothetical protein